jgi:hypothetical protein
MDDLGDGRERQCAPNPRPPHRRGEPPSSPWSGLDSFRAGDEAVSWELVLETWRPWALALVLALGAVAALWRIRRRGKRVEITTEYEGIEYTHRVLWKIVEDQARIAAERGERGATGSAQACVKREDHRDQGPRFKPARRLHLM